MVAQEGIAPSPSAYETENLLLVYRAWSEWRGSNPRVLDPKSSRWPTIETLRKLELPEPLAGP